MKPIFRYSNLDALLIVYTLVCLCLPYVLATCYVTLNIWWAMFAIAHAFLIANYRNSAMHHQGHWPVFFNKKWNSIYETFASVVSGTPTQSWKCNHFLHHKHVNDYPVDGKTKDPTSVYRFSKTKDPSNFWIYAVKSTASDFLSAIFKTPMSPQLHKIESLRQQNLKEVYAYKLYLISIFLLNWKYGLFLLAVYFLASVFDRAISYGEHWGVLDRRGDTTQDSIGIYSRWYNIVGFGAGYHQEHHRSPGTHWTQYHTITDQLAAERKIINSMHITNNPFWSHFKLLFEK